MEELFDFETSWTKTGNYEEQEKILINEFERTIAHFGLDHSYIKGDLNHMASFYEAYDKMDRLLEVYENYVGRLELLGNNLGLIDSLCDLAHFYQMTCSYDEVERLTKKALTIGENMGLTDKDLTYPLEQIACNYLTKRNLYQAQIYYERLLKLYQTIDVEGNKFRRTMLMLGEVYQRLGDLREAKSLYTDLLKLCNKEPNKNEFFIAEIVNDLERLAEV